MSSPNLGRGSCTPPRSRFGLALGLLLRGPGPPAAAAAAPRPQASWASVVLARSEAVARARPGWCSAAEVPDKAWSGLDTASPHPEALLLTVNRPRDGGEDGDDGEFDAELAATAAANIASEFRGNGPDEGADGLAFDEDAGVAALVETSMGEESGLGRCLSSTEAGADSGPGCVVRLVVREPPGEAERSSAVAALHLVGGGRRCGGRPATGGGLMLRLAATSSSQESCIFTGPKPPKLGPAPPKPCTAFTAKLRRCAPASLCSTPRSCSVSCTFSCALLIIRC
mmetsp:Transcript_168543/g.535983  ORF Transcript_168543/g.535983 Transcript_168543/m.535983 type:complete len:284 (-) Transcript_168543:492-1343(-)